MIGRSATPTASFRAACRERGILDGYAAVLEAACRVWNALTAETGRLASLTAYPYLLRSELP